MTIAFIREPMTARYGESIATKLEAVARHLFLGIRQKNALSYGTAAMIKHCQCGGPLVALRSLNLRICADCKREIEWRLDEGQRPLIGNNRQKG